MTENVLELLQKIGLTEYEAKAYSTLLNGYVSTAARLSEESKVPRTKIYEVLESLANKGWIRVYSGYPLLFKPTDPRDVLRSKKEDYGQLIESVRSFFDKEAELMKEKFVVSNQDVGFSTLKQHVEAARTIWVANATARFLKELERSFGSDAEVRVVLFPGEKYRGRSGIEVRESPMKVVNIVKAKEVPAISVILDEERIFTIVENPVSKRYAVSEMLYDDCVRCFGQWWGFGWGDWQRLDKSREV